MSWKDYRPQETQTLQTLWELANNLNKQYNKDDPSVLLNRDNTADGGIKTLLYWMFDDEFNNSTVWFNFYKALLSRYINREICYVSPEVWRMQIVGYIKSYQKFIEDNATSVWEKLLEADSSLSGKITEAFEATEEMSGKSDTTQSDTGKSTSNGESTSDNTVTNTTNTNDSNKNRAVSSQFPQSAVSVSVNPVDDDVYTYATVLNDSRDVNVSNTTSNIQDNNSSTNSATSNSESESESSTTNSSDKKNEYSKTVEDTRNSMNPLEMYEKKLELFNKYMKDPYYTVLSKLEIFFNSLYTDSDRYGWLTRDELESSVDYLRSDT